MTYTAQINRMFKRSGRNLKSKNVRAFRTFFNNYLKVHHTEIMNPMKLQVLTAGIDPNCFDVEIELGDSDNSPENNSTLHYYIVRAYEPISSAAWDTVVEIFQQVMQESPEHENVHHLFLRSQGIMVFDI
jgi:hypothetical protein